MVKSKLVTFFSFHTHTGIRHVTLDQLPDRAVGSTSPDAEGPMFVTGQLEGPKFGRQHMELVAAFIRQLLERLSLQGNLSSTHSN